MRFSRAVRSILVTVCLRALAGCSLGDGSNADPADIAAAPSVHIVIENSSAQTLNLPRVDGAGSGWLRVDEHPSWFVWSVPPGFDSSGICEDVGADQVGEMPTEAATLRPGESFEFSWKTNAFGAGEERHSALGTFHCIHVAPVPHGIYSAHLCANRFSTACKGASEFPTQCSPVALKIGPGDTTLDVELTAELFPPCSAAP